MSSNNFPPSYTSGASIPATLLRWAEPLLLLIIVFVFWYPAPPVRDQWLWLLLLLIPILLLRWWVYRRLWTRSPLDPLLAAFIVLGALNIYAAPYTRGILMLGRPLLGIALYIYCVEYARLQRRLDGLLAVTVLLGLLVALGSLVSTQWVENKAEILSVITNRLPTVDLLPAAYTTFNPNEIAGALAWLCPLCAGLIAYQWQQRCWRWLATVAFGLMFVGLFLGQSRAALLGVFVTLMGLSALLIRSPRLRWGAVLLLGLIAVFELLLVFNLVPFATPGSAPDQPAGSEAAGLSERDTSSFSKRLGLWRSGLEIMRDYPLTGVGMSMYRHGPVREAYPAPGEPNPPHAHNEWIQVGTDLGIPGLLVYSGWHLVTGWMLLRAWKSGLSNARTVALAVAAGLLAHVIYGLNDAVTLWDRFAFIFWWLLGLAGAQYRSLLQKT